MSEKNNVKVVESNNSIVLPTTNLIITPNVCDFQVVDCIYHCESVTNSKGDDKNNPVVNYKFRSHFTKVEDLVFHLKESMQRVVAYRARTNKVKDYFVDRITDIYARTGDVAQTREQYYESVKNKTPQEKEALRLELQAKLDALNGA